MLARLRSLWNLAWSPELRTADGVVIAAASLIIVAILWMSIAHYGRTHIELAPFLDQDGVELLVKTYTRIIIPIFAAFLVADLSTFAWQGQSSSAHARRPRRRSPSSYCQALRTRPTRRFHGRLR